ncbi:hypothetical protein ACI2IX_02080 [Leifsonia aquatica]|uniref:hypothetical protein n=1 Tax=Leifsonia aquatica TaxID=144185 RepID=UPI00384D71D3
MEQARRRSVLVRIGRAIGMVISRIVGALMIVGSSLGDARGAGDPQARKGYEPPPPEYRP